MSSLQLDAFAATSLVDMYSNCGLLASARRVFDGMTDKDAPMWNSMIGGYARSGDVLQARELFERMPDKNVISWTSLISGYCRNGEYEAAVEAFSRMREGEVMPNEVTLGCILPACARLGALGLGQRIEDYARGNGLIGSTRVANALVEMYGKCGSIDQARRVFEETGDGRDLCSWNSMIMGMAVHGSWREALELFHDMRARGFKPDDITFVGVLMACTHGGLVEEGLRFLKSMAKDFAIAPKLEHYGCMVDLLGRAGLLKEAYSLIRSMPMEPDLVIWGALLGGCSFHGEVELAEIAAEFLFKLEPWNPGNYVILSNIYASSGHWHAVAEAWKSMRGKQKKKSAGYSIVELDSGTGNGMYKFLAEDKAHPKHGEIYPMLEDITSMMKVQIGCTLDSDRSLERVLRVDWSCVELLKRIEQLLLGSNQARKWPREMNASKWFDNGREVIAFCQNEPHQYFRRKSDMYLSLIRWKVSELKMQPMPTQSLLEGGLW